MKNLIISIGGEKLFIDGSKSLGLYVDVMQLLSRSVRITTRGYHNEAELLVHAEQSLSVELTTLALPEGKLEDLSAMSRVKQLEESADQYRKWWSTSNLENTKLKTDVADLTKLVGKLQARLSEVGVVNVDEPVTESGV